jgi:hypothetical protein
MRKDLILSDAEKRERQQVIERNRQITGRKCRRREQQLKMDSLALVNMNISHKRINIERYKNELTFYYYGRRMRKVYRLKKNL